MSIHTDATVTILVIQYGAPNHRSFIVCDDQGNVPDYGFIRRLKGKRRNFCEKMNYKTGTHELGINVSINTNETWNTVSDEIINDVLCAITYNGALPKEIYLCTREHASPHYDNYDTVNPEDFHQMVSIRRKVCLAEVTSWEEFIAERFSRSCREEDAQAA